MNETLSDNGSSVAEPKADFDIWGWTANGTPDLETLRGVRATVMSIEGARSALDERLTELGDPPSDPQAAGLSRWILGEFARAHQLLAGIKNPCPAVAFAIAECCIKGEVRLDDGRAMRRPDAAAEMLAKHPDKDSDNEIYALWLESLAFDYSMDSVSAGLDAAPAGFKDSAHFDHYSGRVAEFEGEYEQAEAHYKSALEKNPEHRATLVRLAFQYDLGGEDDEAMTLYDRLLDLKPLDVHATINYGVFLEDRERHQEAIRCYRAVLAQSPNHRRALAYLRDAEGSLNMIFDEDVERRHDKRNRLLRIPINDFELSVRARNCLAKMKIETLGDLVQKTEAELLAYKNFGETSLNEIKGLLESKGLRLGMNLDEDPIPMHPVAPGAAPKERAPVELPPGVDPAVLNVVLADMELSVRCRKALAQMKAVTVGDLLAHTEAELMSLKNFGQTSLSELKSRLSEHGVSLKPS